MDSLHQISRRDFLKYRLNTLIGRRDYKRVMGCIRKKYPVLSPNDKVYIDLAILIWYEAKTQKETEGLLHLTSNVPFLIGINGPISAGKSHVAQYMADVLACLPGNPRVSVLNTDNFIWCNKQLKRKKRFGEKGFPSSYDWQFLFKALHKLKKNKSIRTKLYNHCISDIDPKKELHIPKDQDFIIVEGINLLKPTCQKEYDRFLLSDFLDYSIFLDVEERNLKKWFYKRLSMKRDYWKRIGINKKITRKNRRDFKAYSNSIWDRYNRVNIKKHIRPYKNRSDVIITKTKKHQIQKLEFRF